MLLEIARKYAPHKSARYLFHFAALGNLPDARLLAHIASLTDKAGHKTSESSGTTTTPPVLSIGAGLPPVPRKLVNRIQAGEFVDMAELLPDRMGINTAPLFDEEKDYKQPTKTKWRQVTNILEWVQCYSIYVAVLTAKHPHRIQDLMGYQALIVEACLEYGSETWLGYNRRFRQLAAASPDTTWAKIDPTLWNMAFTGQAKARRCKFCFSLTHPSEDCNWAPIPCTAAVAVLPTQRECSHSNLLQLHATPALPTSATSRTDLMFLELY